MVTAASRDEQWDALRRQIRAAVRLQVSSTPLLYRGIINGLPLSLSLWGILILLVRRLIGG